MPDLAHIPPAPPDRLAPLNVFQYLARQWDAVHPYNAAQAIRVRGTPDVGAVDAAWGETLAAMGLGRVRLTPCGHFGFEVLNGEMRDYPVRRVPAETGLCAHLSAELNRPFADAGEPPFRAFVVDGDGHHHLGVAYQHWAADSVSVQAILRELFFRLHDPARATASRPRLQDTGYWGLYGPRHGRWRLDENLFGLARRYFRYRRVRKVDGRGLHDPAVRCHLRAAPVGTATRLRDASRAAGVKVQDVLVAALAEACAAHVPAQYRRRRRDLAVGSIVDLRPLSRQPLADVYGLYLGFMGFIVHEQDLPDWPRLLRSVATQNRHHKQLGIPQTSLAWMLAARLIGRHVPPARLWHFYRKEMPLAGGLSNVNLSTSWAAAYAPDLIEDYVRASPTGPLAPLAVATTSFGDNFSVALTGRAALIDDRRANAFLDTYLNRLTAFAGIA